MHVQNFFVTFLLLTTNTALYCLQGCLFRNPHIYNRASHRSLKSWIGQSFKKIFYFPCSGVSVLKIIPPKKFGNWSYHTKCCQNRSSNFWVIGISKFTSIILYPVFFFRPSYVSLDARWLIKKFLFQYL